MRHRLNEGFKLLLLLLLATPAVAQLRGTGDLGVIVERASGRVQIVDTTTRTAQATMAGLGDLSHASVVYSRDGRYAYVFGREDRKSTRLNSSHRL